MDDLRERLRGCPAGGACSAAAGMAGVHLVGGAVRDLLLGRAPSELDVVVEGDIAPLAARLGAGGDSGRARALRHSDRARGRLPLGPRGRARRDLRAPGRAARRARRARSPRTSGAAT